MCVLFIFFFNEIALKKDVVPYNKYYYTFYNHFTN